MQLWGKQWHIRHALIMVLAVMAFSGLVGLYLVSTLIVFPGISALEKEGSQQKIVEVNSILQYSLSQMASKVHDWSSWDETYLFVQTQNQSFIENNLGDSKFKAIGINLFIITDTAGQIIYSSEYNLQNNARLNVSNEIKNIVSHDSFLWNFSETTDQISGLILLDQPTMITAQPILTNSGEGPIQGSVIFGIYFNNRELTELSTLIGATVNVTSIVDPRIQNDAQLIQSLFNDQVVTKSGTDATTSSILLNDIHSDPVLIVEVNQNNSLYLEGERLYNILLIALSAIGIISIVILFVLFEKQVTVPIIRFTEYVKKLPLDPNQIEEPLKFRSKEMSILSGSIKNSMTQRLETIGEFAGWVGHDLRNPLTGIKSGTYYLKKKYGPIMDAQGLTTLEAIDSCVEYSNKIVNDLLEYSCKIKLDLEETSSKLMTSKLLSVIKIPENVQVVDETSPDHKFMADTCKLERVLNNLATNAFDAMPHGGRLLIKSQQNGQNVELSFTDNGEGMSEETISKLWVPFFTTKAKGMGFGLAICKRMVEAHGGKMGVESTLGVGTTFKIIMPIKQNVAYL